MRARQFLWLVTIAVVFGMAGRAEAVSITIIYPILPEYAVDSPNDSGDSTMPGTLSSAISAASAGEIGGIFIESPNIVLSGTLPALKKSIGIIGTTALLGTVSSTGIDVQSGELEYGFGRYSSFTGSSGSNIAGPAVTLSSGAMLQIDNNTQMAGGTTTAPHSTGGAGVVVNAPGSPATIVNQGTILGGAAGITGSHAVGGSGIMVNGNVALTNSGTIAGGQGGTNPNDGGGGGTGIDADAAGGAIIIANQSGGVIEGGVGGAIGNGDVNGTGIRTAGNVTIVNQSGASILGSQNGASGASFGGGTAIYDGSTGARIINAGTIAGTGAEFAGYGITATGATIVNLPGGLIEGGNGTDGGLSPGVAAIEGINLTVTNAGTIQGGRAGAGTGVQANAINFYGGTNTLMLQAGSTIIGNVVAAGTSTLILGGSTAGTFDMSNIGATAQYQGFTGFEIAGPSAWTLIGSSGANLPVTVDGGSATVASNNALGTGNLTITGGGTLLFNADGGGVGSTTSVQNGIVEVGDAGHPGATLTGAVDVFSGGTLMGHGTIAGNVTNGGDVHPGGSIGILRVAGNYIQSSAGTLTIEITPNAAAGPGVGYDQLAVTGTASLAGTLAVLDDAGTYTVGSRYTVLTAAGGRTGSFATVTTSPGFAAYITPTVSYDANDVYFTIDPTPSSTGGTPPLLNAGQQVPDMLTALTASAAAVGDAVLGDVCGPAARHNAVPGQGCEAHAEGHGNRTELWLSGIGGLGSATGGGALASFHNSDGGVLLGGGIGRGGLTLGLGAGYVATMLNFSDDSSATQNAALGFVYARYEAGPLHLGAMAAYGGGTVDGTRALPGTGLAASGNRGGAMAVVQARAAYDIALGATTIEPRATLAYLHADQAGFTETGGSLLDLTYADTSADQWEGRLTARVIRHYSAGGWTLEPWVEAGMREAFTGLGRHAFITDASYSADVAGISPAPTAGLLGLGIEAAEKNLDLFLRYQGLFAANQNENAFSAGVAVHF